MKDETASAPSPFDQVFSKFRNVIAKDKTLMAVADFNEQNSHSNAYKALCSFSSKSGNVIADEQRQAIKDYHVDQTKRLQAMDAAKELRELCRKNIIKDGGLPQNTVDGLFADQTKMQPPRELVQAFLNMQRECVKMRLSEDDDFAEAIKPGATLNVG